MTVTNNIGCITHHLLNLRFVVVILLFCYSYSSGELQHHMLSLGSHLPEMACTKTAELRPSRTEKGISPG